MPGWIATAQALTPPFGVLAALLWAFIAIVRIQPLMRRARIDGDAALRLSTAQGTQQLINVMREHIDRQDKRIAEIEERMEECETERAEMRGRIAYMEAMLAARGEVRQRIQTEVSAAVVELRREDAK